jgi:transmembrane sensor
MSTSSSRTKGNGPQRAAAAAWVVRHDRGLTPAEQEEFAAWLRADPANETAWRRSAAVWGRFEGFAPSPAAVPARRHFRSTVRWLAGGLAAAAAVALVAYVGLSPRATNLEVVALSRPADAPQTRVLADGTLARLNIGAVLEEVYTSAERRVRLVQGEAYFAVTRDPSRPFVVEAAGVEIEAVGTAFGVAVQDAVIDVLVTEGTVKVAPPEAAAEVANAALPAPLVTAGHRAVVSRGSLRTIAPVVVTEVDIVEVNRANSWRGGLLRLGGATLAELAQQFEVQTGRKLVFADPDLANLRVGGRFPGDDIEGFVQVLQEHYSVQVRRETDGTLVLDRAR